MGLVDLDEFRENCISSLSRAILNEYSKTVKRRSLLWSVDALINVCCSPLFN